MVKKLIVPRDVKRLRLDKFLSQNLCMFSRAKILNSIKEGKVLVDGRVKKPGFYLKGGEKIQFDIIEGTAEELCPYDFPVKIIHEDKDVIIIDKPIGLVVHPPQKGYKETLVNALIFLKRELSMVNPQRPGIVHRLDKETSGVMVLAKNNRAHDNLVKQFKERKVKKEYRAIVWGTVNKTHMVIDLPVSRDTKNRLKMKVSFVNSKNARTEIDVLRRGRNTSYLSLRIHTGRMHQIRVHLNFLGFPIVGDKHYGKKDGYTGMLLHAYKLGFYHPRSGDFVEFVSELPPRFSRFIQNEM